MSSAAYIFHQFFREANIKNYDMYVSAKYENILTFRGITFDVHLIKLCFWIPAYRYNLFVHGQQVEQCHFEAKGCY